MKGQIKGSIGLALFKAHFVPYLLLGLGLIGYCYYQGKRTMTDWERNDTQAAISHLTTAAQLALASGDEYRTREIFRHYIDANLFLSLELERTVDGATNEYQVWIDEHTGDVSRGKIQIIELFNNSTTKEQYANSKLSIPYRGKLVISSNPEANVLIKSLKQLENVAYFFATSLLLVSVIGWIIQRKVLLNPLHEISLALIALKEGNYKINLSYSANNELGNLTRATQELASRLEKNERYAASTALQSDKANIYLRKRLNYVINFVLRPLKSHHKALTHTLKEHKFMEAEESELVLLHQALQALVNRVEDTAFLLQSESSTPREETTPMQATFLLLNCWATYRQVAKERHVDLVKAECLTEMDNVIIHASWVRLRMILDLLILTAIEHTTPFDRVTVGFTCYPLPKQNRLKRFKIDVKDQCTDYSPQQTAVINQLLEGASPLTCDDSIDYEHIALLRETASAINAQVSVHNNDINGVTYTLELDLLCSSRNEQLIESSSFNPTLQSGTSSSQQFALQYWQNRHESQQKQKIGEIEFLNAQTQQNVISIFARGIRRCRSHSF